MSCKHSVLFFILLVSAAADTGQLRLVNGRDVAQMVAVSPVPDGSGNTVQQQWLLPPGATVELDLPEGAFSYYDGNWHGGLAITPHRRATLTFGYYAGVTYNLEESSGPDVAELLLALAVAWFCLWALRAGFKDGISE